MADIQTFSPADLARIADWSPIQGFSVDAAYKHIDKFAKRAKDIMGEVEYGLGLESGGGQPAASFIEVYAFDLDDGERRPGTRDGEHWTMYPAVSVMFSLYAPVAAISMGEVGHLTRPDWEGIGGWAKSSTKLDDVEELRALNTRPAHKRLAIALQESPYAVYGQAFFGQSAPAGFKPKFGDTMSPDASPKDRLFDVFFQLDWGQAY